MHAEIRKELGDIRVIVELCYFRENTYVKSVYLQNKITSENVYGTIYYTYTFSRHQIQFST